MNIIHINREKITKEEVEKLKNFQSLKQRYLNTPKKTPLKNGWYGTGIIGISLILILSVVWFFLHKDRFQKNPNVQESLKMAFINPPLPQCNIPNNTVLYYNSVDTIITFSSGSSLEILKNSLIDINGNIVNGPIEIRYIEFMNPAEIFLSGIPMVYDTAGIEYTFESAGMVEVTGFYNNKPVLVDPEKPIKISLVSTNSSNNFNLYFLDTIEHNWEYKGKDNILRQLEPIDDFIIAGSILFSDTSNYAIYSNKDNMLNKLEAIRANINALELEKPLPPKLADEKKWHFTIDVLPDEFPELNEYKNTIFEIDECLKKLDNSDTSIVWDDVVLDSSAIPLHYFITFTCDKKKSKYLAYPVLKGEKFQIALRKYNAKFQNYQQKLSERKKEEEQIIIQLKQERKKYTADSIRFANRQQIRNTESQVVRSFEIQKFGIWNCDKPIENFNVRLIKPIFVINDTICTNTVYLADISRNALLTIYPGNNLQFDKRSKNMLWTISNSNKLAVFPQDDFNHISPSAKNCNFNLRIIRRPILNTKDFIELYNNGFKEK